MKTRLFTVSAILVSITLLPLLVYFISNAASPYDDDFNSATLDSKWHWIREDPTHWSLTASPDFLRIITQPKDIFRGNNTAPILLQSIQPLTSDDFEIRTKIVITPIANFHQGGLVIYSDDDNYVRFTYAYIDGPTFEFAKEIDGDFQPIQVPAPPDINDFHLRIVKLGLNYYGYYSQDGENWTLIGIHQSVDISPSEIGLLAFNAEGVTSIEIPADFDYFRFSEYPIDQNVALGKPVTVITNDANDNRESPGLYPSDITDGTLDYLPSSWAYEDGCVGYVNDDYNQLMVITVTIDLQGTYDVSRIRYNMGHVERAETWNADSMTTPFGTTSTNPGTPYTGAWTEQTGSVTLSSITVVLEKTRISWPTDWLFIGEIEVYGTPAGAYRPVFDLPVNYPGRGSATEQQFVSAWQACTTSFLDHRYPFEYDGYLVPFWGEELPAADGCTFFENCYDGHEGYDFDDLPRCGGTPVFPVDSGTIVSAFCDRSPNPPYNYRYYGCQVRIRHSNTGYESLYGHLQEDSWFSSTQGRIGTAVTASERIGTIGCTGHCYGSHLHLSIYYEGSYVDPSGWEGNYEDPYVRDRGGPESYRLWLYSPRRSSPVNHALGTNLVSPSGNTVITVPPNAFDEDFVLTVTELAPVLIPSQLASAGHGLVLEARSLGGDALEQLNEDATLEIRFEASDVEGIRANTLSLYAWNAESNEWIILPTTVNLASAAVDDGVLGSGTAITVIRKLGYITLLGEPYLIYLPLVYK